MAEERSKLYPKPTPLVSEVVKEIPPTVFVDNNNGFMLYRQLPDGYKNPSLSYSNIKECMGINFYATNESIGACIFRHGVMYSITDSITSDFFTVTMTSDVEISLVSVVQIDEDTIYLAAIANVKPSNDTVIFASKTISYKGLVLSCPTTVEHGSLSDKEKDYHTQMFNSDGSFNGLPKDDEDKEIGDISHVSYEDYNGSHGFGDVTVVEITIGGGIDSAMMTIMSRVTSDLKNLRDTMDDLPEEGIYSIDSFRSNDALHLLALSKDSLYEIMIKDDIGAFNTFEFKNENLQSEFTNVYFSPMTYVTEKKLYRPSKYDSMYAPAGVFKMYNNVSSIIFNRIENGLDSDGNDVVVLAYYNITPGVDGASELLYDNIKNSDDKLVPTSGYSYVSAEEEELTFVMESTNFSMNTHAFLNDVAAKNRGSIHIYAKEGTYPNQKVDIITVKSVCNFLDYGSPTVATDTPPI